jgi:DNA polymerase-3 subunit beta
MPNFDVSCGISLEANTFKEMIQKVVFAASLDDSRPVLTGVLINMDGNTLSMVATDGFRLAICKVDQSVPLGKKQMIVPASTLKEVVRILGATKASHITLFMPSTGSQVVFRCENVQIVSQLIEGKYPDYQAILPKEYKTRTVITTADLLKACKQANIIAREGSNVVHFHLQYGADQAGKVKLSAVSDETGASEILLDVAIEGQELEIAFNVKFMQDGLETISTNNVVIEANAHNTPAAIRPTGRAASPSGEEEDYLYILMPMHLDGK